MRVRTFQTEGIMCKTLKYRHGEDHDTLKGLREDCSYNIGSETIIQNKRQKNTISYHEKDLVSTLKTVGSH